MSEPRTRNVAIVLYNNVEILDFAGPYEVFFAASFAEGHPFEVFTIAAEGGTVTCSGNLVVQPRHTIDDHPPIDILVIPGGAVGSESDSQRRLIQWVREQSGSSEILASVCTGAYFLGKAGALQGHRATTHWGAMTRMREEFPDVVFVDDERVVDTGHVVTAAGVSAGIDMALHLVERLCGRQAAVDVARYMEYDWSAPEQAVQHVEEPEAIGSTGV